MKPVIVWRREIKPGATHWKIDPKQNNKNNRLLKKGLENENDGQLTSRTLNVECLESNRTEPETVGLVHNVT